MEHLEKKDLEKSHFDPLSFLTFEALFPRNCLVLQQKNLKGEMFLPII